ncbi:Hsp20/alpha crystallin family protein [bacterium]|nr:Hsp20/alpha crystallin family protein [bacterium]
MRFSIMDREPEYLFDVVRKDLERLVNRNYNQNGKYRPYCEIKENEKEYNIRVQLPGINKEDIDIELSENILTVRAEIKQEEMKEEERMHVSEFAYGEYEKSVQFPEEIDAENCSSKYENGILTITLAKKKEEKKNTVQKISVK